jgi:putative transposase
MSRFRKLTHTIWHCQYHIVWVPKYRHRILTDKIGNEVERCVHVFSSQKSCEIIEMNVQVDHVHLICMIPPKLRVSDYMGIVKGRTAIRLLKRFPDLRKRRYWGNHFWTKGYCVDTVGLDEDKIRQYVKYQENKERREEQMKFGF